MPQTGERIRRAYTLPGIGEATPTADASSPFTAVDRYAPTTITERAKAYFYLALQTLTDFVTSDVGRGTLKCSLAYLLGSLATFVPVIANWLGKQDGKHVVATVTVYFHPARSAGSMHEATVLAALAFLYAAFVAFSSMGVSIFFGQRDMLITGHAIVLILFCGGGLGFVAWTKQRLGKPLANVACSLASLAIITTLTKEGSVQAAKFSEDKVVQVLKMVFLGITATTMVNLAISPVSARKELARDFTSITDHLGDLMVVITRAFISGSDAEIKEAAFDELTDTHRATMTKMRKDLAESKWEHYAIGTEQRHHVETRLADCLQRLAQNLGGLKSAAATQFRLTREAEMKHLKNTDKRAVPTFFAASPLSAEPEEINGLDSIAEETEDAAIRETVNGTLDPADMFTTFLIRLGPSVKSLAFTLKQILDELPFGHSDDETNIAINANFHTSLLQAIELFRSARREALDLLSKDKEIFKSHSLEGLADLEEIAASCGHFSFALVDFAEDLVTYLDILEDLKRELEKDSTSRSWQWLRFWRNEQTRPPTEPELTAPLLNGVEADRMSTHTLEQRTLASEKRLALHSRRHPVAYALWRLSSFLHRDDVRFAVKVGLGAALFALPAFLTATRPVFQHFRGEWGLVSYMVVCSMTIGAANTTGYERFVGTGLGAVFAILVWILSHNSPWMLGFLGWLVSIGCFYLILGQGKGPMGRFILLTYNLSALYAYSLSVKDGDGDDDEGGINPEIWEIVLHRVASVIAGCVWGIIVTRVLWPISARQKLKDGICVLWLRMSLIWKRDPLAMFLHGEPQSAYMDIREEAELQGFLQHLETLRKAASSEFELTGPFPAKLIGSVLERTGRMLDSFHVMNVVISKELKATPGEAEVLRHTRSARFALSARISHLFSVLASSVKMEYPLNDVLPDIEHLRDRLLACISEFRRAPGVGSAVTDQDYEMIYAYGELMPSWLV